jgi:hypothetical protein
MSDWLDAIDHRPGSAPEVRMMGTSVLVVMAIPHDSHDPMTERLILRLESNGDLFMAIMSSPNPPAT